MMRWLHVVSLVTVAVVLLLAAPAAIDNRPQQLEIYRAFLKRFADGDRIMLADRTMRFNASVEDVTSCAPSVTVTTILTRHFRTTNMVEADFDDLKVEIVDPKTHSIVDPMDAMKEGKTLEQAMKLAFDTWLLEVSEVGGQDGVVLFERVDGKWVWSDKDCAPLTMY